MESRLIFEELSLKLLSKGAIVRLIGELGCGTIGLFGFELGWRLHIEGQRCCDGALLWVEVFLHFGISFDIEG